MKWRSTHQLNPYGKFLSTQIIFHNGFLEWIGDQDIQVAAGEVYTLPLRLRADPADLDTPGFDIDFVVTDTENSRAEASSESRFIGPTSR